MTELEMMNAIKSVSGNEHEVIAIKRDFSNRIDTHLVTFAITVGLGDELSIITSIRQTTWHESIIALETQIDIQQTIPTAYILISVEVTI